MSENSNQYQYTHVELETVMNNIDEYIMPELQEAYGLSNDDDILIITERGNVGVNPEYKLIPERERYTWGGIREYWKKVSLWWEWKKSVY